MPARLARMIPKMAITDALFGRIWTLDPAREADWDALYTALLPRVHDFFRYRVGPGPEAEDLTAVTFQKAWQARARYRRDKGAFTTWLFTIARNVAVDHFRSRRTLAPLDAAMHVAGGPEADAAAERGSDVDRLGRLLAELPDREREIVALKYGGGYEHRDIARLMGLTESNVGTILHRTVVALRSRWQEGEQ